MKTQYLRAAWRSLLVLVTCALAGVLEAQEPSLSPRSVGQIVNEVLDAVLPDDQLLSGIPAGRRGIVFDYARTTDAFQRVGAAPISSSEHTPRAGVKPSGEHLLDDCDQRGKGSCTRLGSSAYIWIQPVSATATDAIVWAHVSWLERGSTLLEKSGGLTGNARLTGFSAQVHLTRGASGVWKVNKIGRTIAG